MRPLCTHDRANRIHLFMSFTASAYDPLCTTMVTQKFRKSVRSIGRRYNRICVRCSQFNRATSSHRSDCDHRFACVSSCTFRYEPRHGCKFIKHTPCYHVYADSTAATKDCCSARTSSFSISTNIDNGSDDLFPAAQRIPYSPSSIA